MPTKLSAIFACVSLGLLASASADAMQMQPLPKLPSMTISVAQGCGPYGWRGPWGHCHFQHPYYGYYGGPGWYGRAGWNGCPPGAWRGPWGHCRFTPYHGPLPGGGWKP
jgi:hypothetical protein